MEAVESACAEAWSGVGPDCSWQALPPGRRSPVVDDFARQRGMLDPAEILRWVEMVSIGQTASFFVPETIVSLDLTREDDNRFGRCSTGLAAHFSADAAIRHALHEVIERDARGEWQRRGQAGSVGARIAVETIAYGWFQELVARLKEIDVVVRVNRVPGVVPIQVFVVELLDGAEPDRDHAAAGGAGAHEETEAALRAAMLEALQSRLTMIAGARDDLPLRSSKPHRRPLGLGFPTPTFIKEQPLEPNDAAPLDDAGAIQKLVSELAEAGYNQVGWLRLSSDESEAIVVKVVVPGLGDLWRERRTA